MRVYSEYNLVERQKFDEVPLPIFGPPDLQSQSGWVSACSWEEFALTLPPTRVLGMRGVC